MSKLKPHACARCASEMEETGLRGLCPVCLLDAAWPNNAEAADPAELAPDSGKPEHSYESL
jgi:hypothetical protein